MTIKDIFPPFVFVENKGVLDRIHVREFLNAYGV